MTGIFPKLMNEQKSYRTPELVTPFPTGLQVQSTRGAQNLWANHKAGKKEGQ